jgi:hypothetical protein
MSRHMRVIAPLTSAHGPAAHSPLTKKKRAGHPIRPSLCHLRPRSAVTGSTRSAWRAGRKQAINAVAPISSVTATQLVTSAGFTSKSRFERDRVTVSDPTIPMPAPAIIGCMPCRKIRPKMALRFAPTYFGCPARNGVCQNTIDTSHRKQKRG